MITLSLASASRLPTAAEIQQQLTKTVHIENIPHAPTPLPKDPRQRTKVATMLPSMAVGAAIQTGIPSVTLGRNAAAQL